MSIVPPEPEEALAAAVDGEECGECVCHLIAGHSWFPCALPKGHGGGHRAMGKCFEHGEYLGEPESPPRCPDCPEPGYDTNSPHGATGKAATRCISSSFVYQFVPVEARERQHLREASRRWLDAWKRQGGAIGPGRAKKA